MSYAIATFLNTENKKNELEEIQEYIVRESSRIKEKENKIKQHLRKEFNNKEI